MRFFVKCQTIEELKKEYRKLAMKHHPDRGGDAETMARINAEYDMMFNRLKDIHNASADDGHKVHETPEEFRNIVEILSRMDGLEIELCGSWLWIGGNTLVHKEGLKAAGCKWASGKKKWYWKPAGQFTWNTHRGSSMEYIRNKYGSVRVGASARLSIEAA